MESLKNFLQWIYDNFALIICICGLLVGIYQKAKSYITASDEEKKKQFNEAVEITKTKIKERMLTMVNEAEEDYKNWVKAGSLKRSEVISKIYEDYPILSEIVDQESLINFIDETIDDALVTLREILGENEDGSNEVDEVAE